MALFLKILADIAKQKKFIDAGPAASWLWLAGVGHCRLSSTDGYIPRLVVPTLVPGMKSPYVAAEALVKHGLWERTADGGFEVHHYLAWNPSKAELEQMKRDDCDRKRRGRKPDSHDSSVRIPNGIHLDAPRGRTDAPPVGASSPSPSDSPSGFGFERFSEESARETARDPFPEPPDDSPLSDVPPVWGHRATGNRARADTLVGDHRRCVACAVAACARGACVPAFLVGQWLVQCGAGDQAESQVRAFVERVVVRLADGPIGDDPLAFWRAEWKAEHGSQARVSTPTPHSRGAQTVEAVSRAIEKRLARRGGDA